ncbi:hypothetical protein EUTSA_v10010000mg [Eutrema salsugineum]|uniref:Uncharacterized protein n=1 Tax=Eutrema salsugineum TaxID=72664 RepID=V4KCJ4_EUTSA|nr:hypothetical protein EUTSA_v10010000mg [Eutrema salsugineum]
MTRVVRSIKSKNDDEACNDVKQVMKHVDDDVATKKVQVRGRSKEEFSKERNKMKTNSKKPTNKETSVEDEDDFVAYTADYWKPRHHPPKNN